MTRIAVTGATGRMGGNVIQTVQENDEYQLSFAVDAEETEVDGLKVHSDGKFLELLESENPDVVVDFTVPEATVNYAESCAEAGVPLVTGTTGLSGQQVQKLEELSKRTPILKASNFSQGIQVLRQIVREAVNHLPGYEIEVVEAHHSGKTDAPSGTANTIVEDIEEERDIGSKTYGREGEQPKEENEIGIHAIRAGNIKGSHEVMMADNDEVLKIRHESGSRQVFIEGALKAAEWIQNQENSYYSFEDVLEE